MADGRTPLILYCVCVSWILLLLSSDVISVSSDQPEIVSGVQTQTLHPGQSANLACTVKNAASYMFQWRQFFNGVFLLLSIDESIEAKNPVEGNYPNNKTKYELSKTINAGLSLTHTLTINRLNVLDIGLYECSLVKLQGVTQERITSNGTLSLHGVSAGPRIVNTIGTVSAPVGSYASLLCLVADKGNNKVMWKRLKDNLVITEEEMVKAPNPVVDASKKYKIVMLTQDTGRMYALTIYRLSTDDSGDYQCYVQTGQTPYPSQTGRLQTGVSPTLTTTTPVNITAVNNQRVTMDCTAAGVPQPQVSWKRADNRPLPNGNQYSNGTTLTINNMNKDKRGIYICWSSNGFAPDAELKFFVLTEFMPTAYPLEASVGQAVSFPVTLECILEGYPDIVPKWYKVSGSSTTPIVAGDNYFIRNTEGDGIRSRLNYNRFSLDIQRVKESDYGVYRCEGTSGSNKVFSDITLSKSEECVGSGCPKNPVTQKTVTDKGQSCVGDHSCKDGSGSAVYHLSCSLLIITFTVTLLRRILW